MRLEVCDFIKCFREKWFREKRGRLPKIISEFQGAFLEGCQIFNTILIAHECIDSKNRQQCPGLVCKLDFEKA